MVYEWDDFGSSHVISDMCQSHDCRDKLDELHIMNPAFKCTLFAIPAEMTPELLGWCQANKGWVELAVHGFFHSSNYECEKMSYEDFDWLMAKFIGITSGTFVKGFRAPGWQISDEVFKWLKDHNWWVADQGYNDGRRPLGLKCYVNNNGKFRAGGKPVEAYHGHTWNVGEKGNEPNGIYEDFEKVSELVKNTKEFKFVSELF